MTREEAISNVKSFLGQLTKDCQESICVLVPELKGDEMIRQELWEYFHNLQLRSDCGFSPSFTIDDILAYLEKQKEPSPQPHWKPSRDQMSRLFSITIELRKNDYDRAADFLASLYHDLKKLM